MTPPADTPPPEEQAAYDELQAWSFGLGDATFVHQHVVDAWAVQQAHAESKPIGVVFGLVGLHLHLERGFSGRDVQRAHMGLASRRRDWPRLTPPAERGALRVTDVLAAPEAKRVAALDAWCASVWASWSAQHARIAELLAAHGID